MKHLLLNGDVLHLMSSFQPFDILCTDPPYCSGVASNRFRPTGKKYVHSAGKTPTLQRPDFAGDTRDQRALFAWLTLVFSAACAIAKPDAYAFVFSDWRQLPVISDALQAAGWRWAGIIPWDKRTTRPPGRGNCWAQCEYILWAKKGVARKAIGMPSGLYSIARDQDARALHQTGKPLQLIEALLKPFGPGVTVLDPFAGSGTTMVACEKLGQRFEGCEISKEIHMIAANRLDGRALG